MPFRPSRPKDSSPIIRQPSVLPPKPPWIFLGTPAHKCDVHTSYHTSVIKLFDSIYSLPSDKRWMLTTSCVAGGGVAKARNNLAYEMLNTKAEYLLFVDNDMLFEPGDVARLISQDVDIVGGLYCHKRPDKINWCARGITGEEVDEKTGLQKVQAVGTGFLLIKRKVFETMQQKCPEIEFIEDWEENKGTKHWDFFSEGVVKDPELLLVQPTYLTEDWYFSYRARKLGFTVYVDTRCLIRHCEGITKYPLESSLKEIAASSST